MCLKNNSQLRVLDAASVETPHAYGPSLRRLWLEGRRLGQSDLDGWKYVRAWASHRPSAWENEERRKRKGSAHQVPEFTANLARALSWSLTGDPFHPWATEVDGTIWRVRINDFPDELMYSLIIGNENAGNFSRLAGNLEPSERLRNRHLIYFPIALSAALLRCSAVAHSGGKLSSLEIFASSFIYRSERPSCLIRSSMAYA